MTKTKSTVLLVVILVLVLFFAVAAFLPQVTIGKYNYNSPLQQLKKGADIGEGYFVSYDITRPDDISNDDYQQLIDDTLKIMTARLADFNVRNPLISVGNNTITLRADKVDTDVSVGTIASMRGYFVLAMRDSEGNSDANIPTLTNAHYSGVKLTYSNEEGIYYLRITLNDDGIATLKEKTASATSTALVSGDFYVDGQKYETDAFSTDAQYTQSYIFMRAYEDSTLKVLESVLGNGMLPVTISIHNSDSFANNSQPALGDNAALWCALMVGAVAVAFIIAVIVKHGLFGVAAAISFVIEMLLITYVSAYIYLPALDVPAIVGLICVMGLFAFTTFSFFGKLNSLAPFADDSNDEKKLIILCGRARRQTLRSIINIHAVGIVASIVLCALTPSVAKSFAVVLCYGFAFSLLCNLFVTFLLSRVFIAINSNLSSYRLSALPNDDEVTEEAK